MATNKKVSLEVIYEMIDQAVRPLSDVIDAGWHKIYNDYKDDPDDTPADKLELSVLLELAETVALEVETRSLKDEIE